MPTLVVSIIAFLFGFIGSMPLAGPVAILVVAGCVEKEYSRSFRLALGAAVAEAIYAFLAFWGFATFVARHRAVLPIAHGITAVVLVAIGGRFLVWKDDKDKKSGLTKSGSFFLGFSISAINPTLLVTWSAATTALYARQIVKMTGLMAVPFGISAGAGIAAWYALMVWLFKRYGSKFPRGALTWTVRLMGLVLVALGLWSGIELVRYLVGVPTSR